MNVFKAIATALVPFVLLCCSGVDSVRKTKYGLVADTEINRIEVICYSSDIVRIANPLYALKRGLRTVLFPS